MNLYVGNIASSVQTADLQQLFAGLGQVLYAKLAEQGNDTPSTGFAFVYVPNEESARNAVTAFHGKELKGERITVSPMPERPGIVSTAKK